MQKINKAVYEEAKQIVFDIKSAQGFPKENMSEQQSIRFIKIARDFSKNYVHDTNYICDSVNGLYASNEGIQNPYSARQRIIDLTNNPRRHHHTNCLASATYMSREMQKLGIPHNIIVFLTYKEDNTFDDYHGIVLYKYKDKLSVCDLYMGNQFPELAEYFLYFPYNKYIEYFELLTNSHVNLNKAFIYDTDIYPCGKSLLYLPLSEWDPNKIGFLNRKKAAEVSKALTAECYGIKFNQPPSEKQRKKY